MSEKLVVQDEQSLNELIERVREAQKKYAGYLSSRKDSANAYKSAEAKAKAAKAAKKKVAKAVKVHM